MHAAFSVEIRVMDVLLHSSGGVVARLTGQAK
jgi:hypothetical protein